MWGKGNPHMKLRSISKRTRGLKHAYIEPSYKALLTLLQRRDLWPLRLPHKTLLPSLFFLTKNGINRSVILLRGSCVSDFRCACCIHLSNTVLQLLSSGLSLVFVSHLKCPRREPWLSLPLNGGERYTNSKVFKILVISFRIRYWVIWKKSCQHDRK